MYDNLYELMIAGAFANKEEFNSFVNEASPEQIFSLVTKGAFANIEEFKSMYSSEEKKSPNGTSEEEVTESVTETETVPTGSSDSSGLFPKTSQRDLLNRFAETVPVADRQIRKDIGDKPSVSESDPLPLSGLMDSPVDIPPRPQFDLMAQGMWDKKYGVKETQTDKNIAGLEVAKQRELQNSETTEQTQEIEQRYNELISRAEFDQSQGTGVALGLQDSTRTFDETLSKEVDPTKEGMVTMEQVEATEDGPVSMFNFFSGSVGGPKFKSVEQASDSQVNSSLGRYQNLAEQNVEEYFKNFKPTAEELSDIKAFQDAASKTLVNKEMTSREKYDFLNKEYKRLQDKMEKVSFDKKLQAISAIEEKSEEGKIIELIDLELKNYLLNGEGDRKLVADLYRSKRAIDEFADNNSDLFKFNSDGSVKYKDGITDVEKKYIDGKLKGLLEARQASIDSSYANYKDDIAKKRITFGAATTAMRNAKAFLSTLDKNSAEYKELATRIANDQVRIDKLRTEIESEGTQITRILNTNPDEVIAEAKDLVKLSPSAQAAFSNKIEGRSSYEQFQRAYLQLREETNRMREEGDFSESFLGTISRGARGILNKKEFGLNISKKEREYLANRELLNSLAPILLTNTPGISKEDSDFFDAFGAAFARSMTGGASTVRSGTGMLQDQARGLTELGFTAEDFTEEDVLDQLSEITETDLASWEFAGDMMGSTSAIIAAMAVTKKGTKGFSKRNSPIRLAMKDYNKAMDKTATSRFVKKAIQQGAEFKISGTLFNNQQDELSFEGGFLGTLGGELIQKVVGKIPISSLVKAVASKFGSKGKQAVYVIQRAGEVISRGGGEVAEETIQELTQLYNSNLGEQGFWEAAKERFGDFDENMKFVVGSFLMGAAFGSMPGTSEVKKRRDALSPEQAAVVDKLINEVKQTQEEVLKETVGETITDQDARESLEQENEDNALLKSKGLPSGETILLSKKNIQERKETLIAKLYLQGIKDKQGDSLTDEAPLAEEASKEVVEETPVTKTTTREAINKPSTLAEFGGVTFDSPLVGDTYVDGGQVVFEERKTGKIYELGIAEDIMESNVPGLTIEQERVTVTTEGEVSLDGNQFTIQEDLPTRGVEYDSNGDVLSVSLKDNTGKPTMIKGKDAVDIAYQIELQKIQTPEQEQLINEQLEKDEEFKKETEQINELKEVEDASQTETDQDIKEVESIKTKLDAIPKQSTETVDAQESTRDSKSVGEGDVKSTDTTQQETTEEDNEARSKKTTEEKIDSLVERFSPKTEEAPAKTPKQKQKTERQVDNAKKALAKVAPEVEIVVHETDAAYREATGEQNRNQSTRGEYNPETNVININLSKSQENTVAHEVFHALLLSKGMTNAQAQAVTERMLDAVKKVASPELLKTLEEFSDKYDNALQSEESIAELFGILAAEFDTLPKPTQTLIKKWLDRLAKFFGAQKFTDEGIIDLLNTVSGKVASGEVISSRDVSMLNTKVLKNPASTLERKQVGDFEVIYTQQESVAEMIKKGLITEPNDVSFLSGMFTTITSPDDMLAGEIKYDGQVIFEGEGGVFFVTKFGDVWASGKKGTANTIANSLNKQLKENGGKAFLTLTKGTDSKLVSSASGVNSTLAILNTMLDNNLISPSSFRAAVSTAVRKAKGEINLRQSAKDLKIDIEKYFTDPTTSTFEKRGFIVKDIVGNIAKTLSKKNQTAIAKFLGGDINKGVGVNNTPAGKKTLGSQSLVDLIAKIAAEDLTKGLKVGDVYAVIEINSEVEVKEDSHPSYPFHISLKDGSKPILHLPKNRESGSNVLVQKGQDGKYNLDYAVRNVSVVEGKYDSAAATQAVEEGVKRRDKKKQKTTPQTRKQLDAPNGQPSNLNEEQYKLVRTPAFKKWFGNWETDPANASKVVDENGEPMVVYHGSAADFDVFDKKKLGGLTNTEIAKAGFFFASNKVAADQYAFIGGLQNPYLENKLTEARAFFLNIRTPYKGTNKEWNDLLNWASDGSRKYDSPTALKKANKEFKKSLLEDGFDGVDFDNGLEIVAFEPNQVKLADGSNKTFDPQSPSIRKQMDAPMSMEQRVEQIALRYNIESNKGTFFTNQINHLELMSKLRPTGFRLVQNKTKNGWHIRYPNSERVFKISKKSRIGSRKQEAGPSIKDVRDEAKKDGLSKAETVTALKRLGFTQAEIDESYGVKEVKSPSPAKILGKPKDKKVTVNERTALKDQVKLQAQSSRKSVKAYKDAQKSLIDSINEMSRTGVITNAQSKSMIKKVLATNMLNDKLVDRLIDYIEKVYDNADYVDKVSKANKKRKTALKNLRGKVGPDTGLQSVLNELFTLNAKVIPVNKLDSYLKLVEDFGQRKTVLKDLRETGRVIDQAVDIINSVTQEPIDSDDSFVVSEKNTLEELEQALTEATEDVEKEMIKKLIEFKKEQNKEIEENFNRLVKDIRSNNIELDKVIKLKDAIDLARELNNLTKEDIEALVKTKDGVSDYTMVENLEVVKDNMNNGYVSAIANTIMNKVKTNRAATAVEQVVNTRTKKQDLRMVFSAAYGKVKSLFNKKTGFEQQLRNTMTSAVDDVFGNFNKKTIYNNVFRPLGVVYENFTTSYAKNVAVKLEAAEQLIAKTRVPTIMRSPLEIFRTKAKVQMFRLQREYESNPNNKQVASAVDFIDATIKANDKANTPRYSKAEIKILKELKDEFSVEGEIDLDGLRDSFSRNENRAIKLIDEAGDLDQEANWTATVIRGSGIKPIANYVHHSVIEESDKAKDKANITNQVNKMKTTTKAKTMIERTPGAKAIDFDPISSTARGARDTMMDYYMTDGIRVSLATVAKVKEDIIDSDKSTEYQKDAVKALDEVTNEVIDNVLNKSFTRSDFASKVYMEAVKLGYQNALASVPRAAAELGSNMTYAILSDPKALIDGVTKFGKLSVTSQGFDIMKALGSTETMKNYDTKNLTSKAVDQNIISGILSPEQQKDGELVEKVRYLLQFTGLPQTRRLTTEVASKLLSTPDRALSRPLWFASFTRSFKDITGETLTAKDLIEIGEGTSRYLDAEYKDAIKDATAFADGQGVKMSNSRNPFNVIPKNIINVDDSITKKVYKTINGYMASFMLNEYVTFRNAVLALTRSGDMSKAQATGAMAGAVTRMGTYVVLYKTFQSIYDSLFGYEEEEEEEESKMSMLQRQMFGAVTSLITARGMGQVGRMGLNYGLEMFNEEYLGFLRDGEVDPETGVKEYDSFDDAIVFSLLNERDFERKSFFDIIGKTISGPLSPFTKSAARLFKDNQLRITSTKDETKEKYQKRIDEALIYDGLGNLGLLPFYKDLKRIARSKRYQKEQSDSDSMWGVYGSESRMKKIGKQQPEVQKELERIQKTPEYIKQKEEREKKSEENKEKEAKKLKDLGFKTPEDKLKEYEDFKKKLRDQAK